MKQQRRRTCLTVLDKWHTLYGTPGWLDLRHCSGKPTHVIFRRSHGNAIANAWCKTMPSKVCKTKHKYNKKTCWQIPRFSWSGRILQTLKLGQASVPAIISLSNSQSQPRSRNLQSWRADAADAYKIFARPGPIIAFHSCWLTLAPCNKSTQKVNMLKSLSPNLRSLIMGHKASICCSGETRLVGTTSPNHQVKLWTFLQAHVWVELCTLTSKLQPQETKTQNLTT